MLYYSNLLMMKLLQSLTNKKGSFHHCVLPFLLMLLVLPLYSVSQTPPTAQFTGTTSICVHAPASFTNQSTQGSSPITTYTWDFGDGSGSSTQNPTHTYTIPGTYTVTLVVQAGNGQADSEVKSNFIVVHPQPVANFTLSTNGCVLPVGVIFSNATSGATSYAWNFGNGQTSTQPNPATVNYTTPGTYTATLITTNQFGCKDTVTKPIVISNFQSGITAPATACAGTPVTISDNSTVGANSWNWNFGGATPASSTTSTNSVIYNTPGTYTITLSSQNTALGCSSNATSQITILPKPTPSFTNNPTTGCAPLTVNFTNTGSQTGATYSWDFGNGNISTAANPSTVYNGNGSYVVTLTMTSANGCSASISQNAVTLTSPQADFVSDVVNGCADLDVQFTSTSTTPDPITQWNWSFGDGTTYSGQTPPVHTYGVGVYDVTLIITTQHGCIDTITKTEFIEVGEINQVNFTIDASPECVKRPIDFTDQTVITAPHTPDEVTYHWDFGDGGTSSEQNPTHQYASDTGYFDITLIVNFRGCLDTLIQTDAVYIKAPLSRFTLNQTLFCNPQTLPVTLNATDNAIIGVLSDNCLMTWKWGDGTTTTLSNTQLDNAGNGSASHTYSNYGSYTIEQVIHNYTTGCSDSTSQVIHVSQTIASFGTFSLDSVCVGSPFVLSQGSTSTHPFGTYIWNMGDGGVISGLTPGYTYSNFGDYTITLTATNSVGCAAQATYTPFTALALPVSNFTASDLTGCSPFLVNFSNTSTAVNNGVPLASFAFSFQDDGSVQNTTSVSTPVNHTFLTEGSYAVTLVATDEFGCVSAPSSLVVTITKPVAIFSIDSVVCKNETAVTVNTSTGVGPLSYEWFVNGSAVGTDTTYAASYQGNATTSSSQYNYVLITTDANGCKDTTSHVLTVSTPIADADYVFSGASVNASGQYTCPPVFSSFTDNSSSYGAISNYSWTFGDGKTSTLENPSNTYVFPGTYSMSLTITDEFGCVDDTTFSQYLTIFGPTATASWVQSTDFCGQYVTFLLADTANIATIVWNFGDGTTLNDSISPTHHYTEINTFVPTVTLTDDNNCQVIYPMDTITISDNGLTAFFTANPQEADLGQEILLVDGSSSTSSTITNWYWTVDGYPPYSNTTNSSIPIGYPLPGYYDAHLIIVDDMGCTNSYGLTIHVTGDFSMPNVFTPNGDGANDFFSFAFDIFQSYDLIIVNRWGNVLVDEKGMTGTQFWNGNTQGGEPCSDGVYFYYIKGILKDGTTTFSKDGFVTLVRH